MKHICELKLKIKPNIQPIQPSPKQRDKIQAWTARAGIHTASVDSRPSRVRTQTANRLQLRWIRFNKGQPQFDTILLRVFVTKFVIRGYLA